MKREEGIFLQNPTSGRVHVCQMKWPGLLWVYQDLHVLGGQ